MLVGNIVEKPSSSSTAPAPRPPSSSSSFAHAFPPVLHRSQRPPPSSRFSSGLKKHGESSSSRATFAAEPAGSGSRGTTAKEYEEMTEVETIRQSVNEENTRRVAEMTQEERDEEVRELKERFGPGLEGIMRKRREQRMKKEGKERTPPAETQTGRLASPEGGIDENSLRVQAMSAEERQSEIQELEERFGSTVIDALRQRAAKKAQSSGVAPDKTLSQALLPSSAAPLDRAEDLSQSDMKAKYFPDLQSEPEKMAWFQSPAPSSSDDSSPRFDLSGRELSATDSKDLPSNIGLHHHGSSPDLAGYTIDDVLHLCQSTVSSQRITMMGVLSRIVSDYIAGKSSDVVKGLMVEKRVCEQAINLAVGAILLMSKSAGVFRAGVDLFYEALGGSQWSYLHDDEVSTPFHPTENHVDLASVAWEDVVPTFGEMLDTDSLSPRTTNQILLVLMRLAALSEEHCELVTPLLPDIIRTHVLLRPWPATNASIPPSSGALALMAELIISSRRCATALVDQGIIEPLLKFPLTLTWDDTALGMNLTLQTLRIFASLARYGLATSIARSGSEPLDRLRQWLTTAHAPEIKSAYFDLLRNWIVCATDPHKTTPEHDLTWAQVSALGWAEDVIQMLGPIAAKKSHAEVGAMVSGLGVVTAWVEGSEINGFDKGSGEKKGVVEAFKRLEIIESVSKHFKDDREGYEAIIAQFVKLNFLTAEILSEGAIKDLLDRQDTLQNPSLQYNLLQLAQRNPTIVSDPALPVRIALDTITSFQPGSEPVVLDLIDLIIRSDHKSQHPNLAFDSLPSDGLEILRPLLHYTVLPDLTNVVGPTTPRPDYLKATSTLRPSQPPGSNSRKGPGLPLSSSWFFSPLDELLHSATSMALAQTPPDWDPSELHLLRAILILAEIRLAQSFEATKVSRSELLLNLMKVFMLEHGQQTPTNQSETDLFRDPIISKSLKSLISLTLSSPSPTTTTPPLNLEQACLSFLGSETPFFQWYTDFLALYESISFSDHAFTQLLLPPLAMTYPVDYRRLFWSENTSILRGIRLQKKDFPLEDPRGIEVYFEPVETDQNVLDGMIRAAARGWLREGTFLHGMAVHHLSSALWAGGDESVRKGLMVGVLSTCPDEFLRAVFSCTAREGAVVVESRDRREAVGKLAGPRGTQRLDKLGL